MPDISLCQNKECPSKDDCYRFTAKPSEFSQIWATFDFGVGVCCDSYIPNEEHFCIVRKGDGGSFYMNSNTALFEDLCGWLPDPDAPPNATLSGSDAAGGRSA
jgi:hypothetical protein